MEESKASPHLAGKFKVVGVQPGEVVTRNEVVDLRTISLAKAEELFKRGFRYLERINPEVKTDKSSTTTK